MTDTTTTELWYDTEGGMTKALEHGLAGLHEIVAGRNTNYGKQHLREWCLLGRFYLDSVGSFSTITEGAPADRQSYEIYKQIRPVMRWHDAKLLLDGPARSSGAGLPKIIDTCDRCRGGWKLDNCHDVAWDRNWTRPRHRLCNELAVIQEGMHEIYGIFKEAEIEGPVFFIPNRYWPPNEHYDDVRTPWAIVQTERGPIRIGWRKRVIEIDWFLDGSKFTATGSDVAAGDQTTTDGKLVHAWGRDKAVEYLRRLWASQVTP